ncbi:MAG TPA: sterol desaturase family protein [Flavisolibacter sp.]|nr:sterol desaturase family protein [Flavisolibacter sp.]
MPPAILYYAIPGFLILLALEAWLSYKENKQLFEIKDTWSSLGLGIGNVIIGFATKAIIFGLFSFLYQFRFFELSATTWWYWIFLFLADDLSYYFFHRTAHNVNWFWASHVVHHSSRKYNLAAALRQTWTGNATGAFLFWAWLPLLGFHPIWILFMQQISLIYQFWIHTETIQKLPKPFELVFNTPSHHRVHHGSDLKYLDKNHGGILIIWDRLFKTFQPEEERPTYGLTKNIDSFNPVIIALKTWRALIRSAARSGSLKNAINYFVQPPGWSHDGSTRTVRETRKKIS